VKAVIDDARSPDGKTLDITRGHSHSDPSQATITNDRVHIMVVVIIRARLEGDRNVSQSPQIDRVSHVALEVADPSAMTEFYRDSWGLEVTEESDGNAFLRTGSPDHHAVALYAGSQGRLHHVGFEVRSSDELERVVETLAKRGDRILYGPGPSPDEPGVDKVLRFADPDGNVIELYTKMAQVKDTYGTREVKPRGLDHVVIQVADLAKAEAFYTAVLGFRVSDWVTDHMTFLRCNANHHSLAVMRGVPGFNHAAFTVSSWEEIAKSLRLLGERQVQRTWGPGRHGPGNNLFVHYSDPEGNALEYTAEVIQIDDKSWKPGTWDRSTGDVWGGPPLIKARMRTPER
jgi:catechol-2,3-dioxygenase